MSRTRTSGLRSNLHLNADTVVAAATDATDSNRVLATVAAVVGVEEVVEEAVTAIILHRRPLLP